ncbi:MAG TPA: hypothetical protein VGQ99_06210 [Tepidisphaeraceae bacterium]|nr:hypothetical protein [Tepidisphaeraceae bacterium]
MKQAAVRTSNPKMSLPAASSDVQGFKRTERAVSPASPPQWNRYIDCRLKQFGTIR